MPSPAKMPPPGNFSELGITATEITWYERGIVCVDVGSEIETDAAMGSTG